MSRDMIDMVGKEESSTATRRDFLAAWSTLKMPNPDADISIATMAQEAAISASGPFGWAAVGEISGRVSSLSDLIPDRSELLWR
jgi:hypothetical protein